MYVYSDQDKWVENNKGIIYVKKINLHDSNVIT